MMCVMGLAAVRTHCSACSGGRGASERPGKLGDDTLVRRSVRRFPYQMAGFAGGGKAAHVMDHEDERRRVDVAENGKL
jgi:hypothetical protein